MILKKTLIPYTIEHSKHFAHVSKIGDFGENYNPTFPKWDLDLPTDWRIIAIIGESGKGKSGLLKTFQDCLNVKSCFASFDNRMMIENIHDDPEIAADLLHSVGMNTLTTWLKPFHVMSLGEQYRAQTAQILANNDDILLDEFTSVLDRDNGMALSNSLHKSIHRMQKRLIVATCHRDILEYLKPCYVVDLDKEIFLDYRSSWGSHRRSKTLELVECDKSMWSYFAQYHYLTSDLPSAAVVYLVRWKEIDRFIGFTSYMVYPNTFKMAQECRTVCLPQFQGMGIGTKISELIAEVAIGRGYRFYSKTGHDIMGKYRNANSHKWRPTERNMKSIAAGSRKIYNSRMYINQTEFELNRITYAHEYVGKTTYKEPEQLRLF